MSIVRFAAVAWTFLSEHPSSTSCFMPTTAAQKIKQLPATVHIYIFAGDTWSTDVGINLDLTDYEFTATITPAGGGEAIELDITEPDLANGQFSIDLSLAQSANIPVGYHTWEVSAIFDGERRTYIHGNFIVSAC